MKKRVLALCDKDESYVYRLQEQLSRRESFPFAVSGYTDEMRFCEDVADGRIGLILASESFYKLAAGAEKHPPMLLLKEKNSTHPAEEYIWKYQSAENIRRQLMERYASDAESASAPAGDKTTELIGIFSPVCRSIQTSFSLLMGQFLAKRGSVLYLNFEPFSGLSKLLKNPADRDLTDLIYYLEGGRERLIYKLESMVGNVNGLDYISPAFSFVDLGEVKEESWLLLIRTLKEMGTYDYVILDLSEMVRGVLNVLRECERIYTLTDREGMSLSRMEQYEELLGMLEYSDVLRRSTKCDLPKLKKLPSGIEELPYSDLAGYVRRLVEEGETV